MNVVVCQILFQDPSLIFLVPEAFSSLKLPNNEGVYAPRLALLRRVSTYPMTIQCQSTKACVCNLSQDNSEEPSQFQKSP